MPRAMSGSVALQKPGSGVVFKALVAIEGSVDAQGLASHLKECYCQVSIMI